jgi:hypothetical protein
MSCGERNNTPFFSAESQTCTGLLGLMVCIEVKQVTLLLGFVSGCTIISNSIVRNVALFTLRDIQKCCILRARIPSLTHALSTAASNRNDSGSIPVQVLWDLWWAVWY